MDYTRLENLRNTYPAQTTTDLNNIKTFYSKEEGYVRKYGKDRTTNYLDFKTYPLDKLNVLDPNLYPYVDFNFIVHLKILYRLSTQDFFEHLIHISCSDFLEFSIFIYFGFIKKTNFLNCKIQFILKV